MIGKDRAKEIYNESLDNLKRAYAAHKSNGKKTPILLIVGDTEEPSMFAKLKIKDFAKAEIEAVYGYTKPINGIIKIEFPFPSYYTEDMQRIFSFEFPNKHIDNFSIIDSYTFDVDHLTDVNMLFNAAYGDNALIPCTSRSVLRILSESDYNVSGKNIVVLGRSYNVTTPLSLALIKDGATVSVLNSHTPKEDMERLCKNADVIISATGRENIITADLVKENAIVIDVGGGDVDYENVKNVTPNVTPPTGIAGVITRAMVMESFIKYMEIAKKG